MSLRLRIRSRSTTHFHGLSAVLAAAHVAVIAAVLATAIALPAAADHVTGLNVTEVDFGSQGRVQGTFIQIGDGSWVEVKDPTASRNEFIFEETGRDERSVYLRDGSRGVDLQLDLGAGKVFYSDRNTSRSALYDIVGTSGRINGWLVRRVSYGANGQPQGILRENDRGGWDEIPNTPSGTRYSFEETDRDAWSVQIEDPSRDVTLVIDLKTQKIYYSDRQVAGRELYQISGIWAQP